MMVKRTCYLLMLAALPFAGHRCNTPETAPAPSPATAEADTFQVFTEQFADVKILRYYIPAWDALSLQQKKLAYYLTQAGFAGRDMIYDQNYRHNLEIRRVLEHIYEQYTGDRTNPEWQAFELYLKRLWFANGIHHHYSGDKFDTGFSATYFGQLLKETGSDLSDEALRAMFDPAFDAKKVSKDATADLLLASAVNFYAPDITQREVEAFYSRIPRDPLRPLSLGLNSRMARDANGKLREDVYKLGGRYGESLGQVVYWLKKASEIAENDQQKKALNLLIAYYETGDLNTWDEFNIAWVKDTASVVDYIHGFVEVYEDPMGYRGTYESIVQVRDLDASAKMKVIAEHAQYFEQNSTTLPEHKKDRVVGITYNFINVVGEAGDAAPSTPVGVNLPNANWIRAEHGSKSVSLGNISAAYERGGTPGLTEEYCHDSLELALHQRYAQLASKLHTALHEVIGHASGKINPGVGSPKESLKNYGSTIEEARADLVALYFIMDPKLIEIGVMDHLDVGRSQYDSYIKNGLMLQLRRIRPGANIEQDHMRNRQLVSAWAFELGRDEGVIERVVRDGKTYFNITDYDKLRDIFGRQLREIQRITSEGDFEGARDLVERYGVRVDRALHEEVLARAAQFQSAPYAGFIQPILVPVEKNGEITDVRVTYPNDFAKQMLYLSKRYSTLVPVSARAL